MGFGTFTKDTRIACEKKRYRLVRKNNAGEWLLEDLDDGNVTLTPERTLDKLYCAFKMTFLVGPTDQAWKPVIQRIQFTPEERALIKLRLTFVNAVEGLPISRKDLEGVIKDAWRALKGAKTLVCEGLDDPDQKHAYQKAWRKLLESRRPFGWITVYRWARRYHKYGDDEAALLDKNRGKRDRNDIYDSVVVGLCELAIDERYMRREPRSVRSTWTTAKQWVADAQQKLDDEYERTLKEQREHYPAVCPPKRLILQPPAERFIRRLIEERPAFDRYAARHGMDAAIRRFRFKYGRDLPSEPLEEAQLDHTVLDLFVVDDENWLPLGRPYITACLDSRTRCVLGIYVGFIPPSSLSVALCLKDAFMPKDYELLYPEIENTMPFGIPRKIKWDNGLEEHSAQAIEGCGRVGVRTIIFCPRKKPWYKAEIERFFRTLNEDFAHEVPGTTFSNTMKKGDYNPQNFAVVRLSTLRLGIRKWIADVYHTRPHRVLGISPLQAWNQEIREDLRRRPDDPRFLDAIMGRRMPRKLTNDGIRVHNLWYANDALRDLRTQYGPTLDIEISVNEENLGKIYVFWKDQIIEVRALDFGYADGLTLWQHKLFQAHQREHNLPETPDGWMRAKEEVHQLFEFEFTGKCKPKGYARLTDRGEKAPSQSQSDSFSEVPASQDSDDQNDTDLYAAPKPVVSVTPSYVLPEEAVL
jgi:putative transposase